MQLFLEERKMEMIFGILSHSLHTQVYQMINFKLAIPRVKITMSETHMKTEDELARNPDLKKEDLVELRQWLRIQGHLSSISEEDLTLFLHSCYYDVAKTKDCIEKYYNIRTTTPELFTKRDMELPENQKMLSVLNLAELPVKDPNGYHILFHSLKQTEPSKYIFADAARVYLMMIDICIKHEGPSPGIVLLFDLTGVKFGHLRRLSLSLIRKFLVYLQIHFHKGNNETVYEYLPKKCLPKDFGGELPTVAELDGTYSTILQHYHEYFKEDETSRANENGSHRRENRLEDVPQSVLRSLVID
ncbi:retinol-binding protein pinta-like isoform X2 [Periplaneta americana]|uniref:retinol-binding protein pinta-like isoform X2 n=1 Tax=Periplaneta americana TaxID=6978 RepID=UPI0037E7275E